MPTPFPASAAILIGGDSRRMGQDKAALLWDGQTLTERSCQKVSPLVEEVLLVTQDSHLERATELAPSGVRVITDRLPARGPLAGIHAALHAASFDRVLVVACDMPHLQTALLQALLHDLSAQVIVPRTARGFEPLLAVYDRPCLPAVENILARGPSRVPALYSEVSVSVWNEEKLKMHDPSLRSLINVNRPDDLERD